VVSSASPDDTGSVREGWHVTRNTFGRNGGGKVKRSYAQLTKRSLGGGFPFEHHVVVGREVYDTGSRGIHTEIEVDDVSSTRSRKA